MKKTSIILILLSVVLFIAAAISLFFERKKEDPEEDPEINETDDLDNEVKDLTPLRDETTNNQDGENSET